MSTARDFAGCTPFQTTMSMCDYAHTCSSFMPIAFFKRDKQRSGETK